jgi:fatty acid-binding protein DegV
VCISENDTAGLLKYQKISKDLYLQLDPEKKSNSKSEPSPEESLELINFLEEQNKRIIIFFESISKKP